MFNKRVCHILVLSAQLIILGLLLVGWLVSLNRCDNLNQWLLTGSACIMAGVAKFETVTKYFGVRRR